MTYINANRNILERSCHHCDEHIKENYHHGDIVQSVDNVANVFCETVIKLPKRYYICISPTKHRPKHGPERGKDAEMIQ